MKTRVRYRDFRHTQKATMLADNYIKTTCAASAAWANYYSADHYQTFGEYESMQDSYTPGFHKLLQAQPHAVVFGAMSKRRLVIDSGTGTSQGETESLTTDCSSPDTYKRRYRFSIANGTNGWLNSGFRFAIYPDNQLIPPTILLSEGDLAAAITEVGTAVRAERDTASNNLWESLAELEKSARLATDLLRNINGVLTDSLVKKMKAGSSAWLAYRYGLLPLMSDLDTVLKGMLKERGARRVTSRAKLSLSRTEVSLPSAYSAFATFRINRQITKNEVITIRGMSLDETEANWGSNIGLTTKGLATLPWELLPYSFVVDWFVNVGEFINALYPSISLNQLGACIVMERKFTQEYQETGYIFDLASTQRVVVPPQLSRCSYEYTEKTRTLGLPMPGLVIKSDFRFDSVTRASDAIALIVQKLL